MKYLNYSTLKGVNKFAFPQKVKEFIKLVWPILLLGILLRIFLAFFTFHPDLRAFNLAGSLIASGNLLNLYDYLASCTPDNPLLKTFGWDLFIYPPAIYLLHGAYNFIFSHLFGNDLINGHIIESTRSFGNIWFNLHLLLIKFPYFLFDIAAAFVIAQLFEERRKKLLAFALWMFNPISIYATYMMGQFDMIPAFFTIVSLYYAQKNKLYLSVIALGIGAAFKLYPLFLLPPLLLLAKRWESRSLVLIAALAPYILTVLPFIQSHGFRATALLAGLTQKTLYAQIPVSGGESLLLFPMLLVLLFIVFFYSKNTLDLLWQKQFIILLLFFILTHFHPQWLVWLTPFLIIELVNTNFKHLKVVLLLLIPYILSLFLFDTSLTLKIFAPLVPSLYDLPPDLKGLGISIDINYFRSILQSIFAAACLFFILLYRPTLKHED
jgi:hypothetical protein